MLSIRWLWVLWHAAMTPYPDSAILSHLPLTTDKVFLMLVNGETALCPQTEEGRYLFIRPEGGIMKLRRDLTTPSLPFMMPQNNITETAGLGETLWRHLSIAWRWLLMTCDSCRSLGDSDDGGLLGLVETVHAVFTHSGHDGRK